MRFALALVFCVGCGNSGTSSKNHPTDGGGGDSGGGALPDLSSAPGSDMAVGVGKDAGGGGTLDLGPPIMPGDPGTVDITFQVHSDQNVHAISPYIYGVNSGAAAAPHHATIVRSGGNRLTAFNWETNASNAGTDYGGCENDDLMCNTGQPGCANAGTALKNFIDQATSASAAAYVTVPIVDYVAGDENGGMPINCTFNASRFKQNKPAKGSAFADPPDITDNFVYQDEMVNWLSKHESGATLRFLLDNEPDLWSSTHPEVHPTPVTYAELSMRTVSYAKAIKAVMPTVEVWGPASYGWAGYVNLQSATDSGADGDFLNWYLDQMKTAETSFGKPVLDGLDLHWYPEQGDGGGDKSAGGDCRICVDPTTNNLAADCTTAAGIAGTAAFREQAPRSMWDTTYVENSWIAGSLGNKAIALIPSVKAKIAAHDAKMKLAFSEWNYGGGSDISGSIASADVLGIYGAYGVDMAMLWETWHDESFTYAAFDAYRNFDGKGAAFGDTSIGSSTSDVPNSSVWASISASDPSRLIIIAINKSTSAKKAGLRIFHPTAYSKASVYTLTQSGGAKLVAGPGLTTVASNTLNYMMPAQSVSVIIPAP